MQLALVISGELALSRSADGCSPSTSLVGAVQSLLSPHEVAEPTDGETSSAVHGALAAYAIVALGKYSLGSSELAKRLAPVFLHELMASEVCAVRNNALVVLFDLAKAHTAILERHFGAIALALYDASPVVRHQATLVCTRRHPLSSYPLSSRSWRALPSASLKERGAL